MSLRTRFALWFENNIVGPVPEGCEDLTVSNLDRRDWSTIPESLKPTITREK